MKPRGSVWLPERTNRFHTQAIFCALWILVFMVGLYTMKTLRPILEPLIWAFFIMMGLLPLCDLIEWSLIYGWMMLRLIYGIRSKVCERNADGLQRQYTGELRPDTPRSGTSSEDGSMKSAEVDKARRPTSRPTSDNEAVRYSDLDDEENHGPEACLFYIFRVIAVLVTIIIFLGGAVALVCYIYRSAEHMQKDWKNYQDGAAAIFGQIEAMRKKLPHGDKLNDGFTTEVLDRQITNALTYMQSLLSFIVQSVFHHVSAELFQIFMTVLYMVFWLSQPMYISETYTRLFKRYILLKSAASAMYALCIYLWLLWMKVDLAIVFGLIAFLFNFVPEVGTIAACLLPTPVVLFDGRRKNPLIDVLIVLGGAFGLKFLFSNIVEVNLVAKQHDFRMHPVIILFFVASFGSIWGPTGMLVSVPVMAAFKAAAQAMPPQYRDPILVFFEGDKNAAKKNDRRRKRGESLDHKRADE